MTLDEMGNAVSYAPHADMNHILFQRIEHPLPPQESIVLLHRSSTRPLHYDVTQPATRILSSSSITAFHQIFNPLEPNSLNEIQDHAAITELQPLQTMQYYEEPTNPLKPQLHHQELPLDYAMPPDDTPFKSTSPNEDAKSDKPSETNDAIEMIRPQSPTC